MNGYLGNYSHTRETAVVSYQCSDGFRPSAVMTSICSDSERWIPSPENLNCTLIEGIIFMLIIVVIIQQFNLSICELGTYLNWGKKY